MSENGLVSRTAETAVARGIEFFNGRLAEMSVPPNGEVVSLHRWHWLSV